MARFTRKIRRNTNYYCEYELKDCPYSELYDLVLDRCGYPTYADLDIVANGDLTLAIDFLADIENVLAKHHIRGSNKAAALDQLLTNAEKDKQIADIIRKHIIRLGGIKGNYESGKNEFLMSLKNLSEQECNILYNLTKEDSANERTKKTRSI